MLFLRPTSCPYSEKDVGHIGWQPLELIWNGPGFGDMRHRFQAYRVKGGECESCVKFWKEGVPGKSPALVEFDSIPLAPWKSSYVPQVLRLDLGAPLSSMDLKTVFRWLPRLTRLSLIVPWPVPPDSFSRKLLDHAATLSGGKRPTIMLQIHHAIPEAHDIPDGIAEVQLSLAMDDEQLSSRQEKELEVLAHALQVRDTALVLEVSVHQENWFHLRSWLMRTRGLGVTLVPLLVPPSEKASLAELDGDALACLHTILGGWVADHVHATTQGIGSPPIQAMLDQLRQWQHDAAERLPQRSGLAFPDLHHSLVQDEAALEPFLAGLLRIYPDPSVECWLMGLLNSQRFVTEARRRRSFRLAALWLACVFNRSEALVSLQGIFRNPKTASQLIDEDRNALIGTMWENWFDGWTEQLYLKSLQPRKRRFHVGLPQVQLSEEPATITVIIATYNQQGMIGQTIIPC